MADHTSLVLKGSPAADDIEAWRTEIDGFLVNIRNFSVEDPDVILQQISAIAARLIEIKMYLVRSESRRMQTFRTKELDPLLDHVEFQFRVNSRRLALMKMDWEMSGPQP